MKSKYSPEAIEKMRKIADSCVGNADPYCVASCPMNTDVKGYINLIAEGKYEESLSLIREKLFLPATLGRICAHPCEDSCKRGELLNPLSIAALKRFVADRSDSEDNWDLEIAPEREEHIAVIGAGPAGAQGALDLRRNGYRVTVFDRLPVLGGMMRVGIPEYRLPRNIIDFEYGLLEKIGVRFRLGVEIGKDISFEQLRKDFDAILIAVGAHKSIMLPIKGVELDGVLNAVDFLREVSFSEHAQLGKKVIVIGGGNVAIDAARSALRVGAEEVHMMCLESRDEMPAHLWEVEEAEEEGVRIHNRLGPHEITGKEGKLTSIIAKKCTSLFDDSGAFRPLFDEDAITEFLDVDRVIFAIGQSVDGSFAPEGTLKTAKGGRLVVDPVTLQTSLEDVFAAGDSTGISVIAVEAMAEGRKAAESIDKWLNGRDLHEERTFRGSFTTELETSIDKDEPDLPRIMTIKLPAELRRRSFSEVDFGLSEEQAVKEASRCLKCECKLCMKECEMLGDFTECPGELFSNILSNGDVNPLIPYSCNMCKQCTIVCPKDFLMMDSFMDMRKELIGANKGKSPIKGHGAIEVHQKLGFSKLFNSTNGSAGNNGKAKRVFVPGCSLPSYNPQLVEDILRHLQDRLPGTGSILKCCGKPTKALGQYDKFKERYGEFQAEVDKLGAEEIIVACQSCYVTMKEYSPDQKVRSLWEVLPEIGLPDGLKDSARSSNITIAIHDSCPTRDVPEIFDGVRWIVKELGYRIEEPPHTRENTRCCGFGGMVVPANPDLALRVMKRRTAEIKSDYVVTYCAACRESMVKGGKDAVHILDLIFGNVWTSESAFPGLAGNPLASWINRYKAKSKMRQAAR